MAIDLKRGIVFVPTGSAASDFYGANRAGDNLFANCLLALDAATGKRIWHFQVVKHDIWDRDLPSPPVLVTVKRDGKTVDAVAQTTKQGFVFLFDRDDRQAAVPHRVPQVPAQHGGGRSHRGDAAAADQARAVRASVAHRGPADQPHAGGAPVGARAVQEVSQRRPVCSLERRTRRPWCFRVSTAARNGAARRSIRRAALLFVNANDLAWTASWRRTRPAASGRELFTAQCAACHATGPRPEWRAGAVAGGHQDRGAPPEQITDDHPEGHRPHARFSQSARRSALRALVQYLVNGESKEAMRRRQPSPFDLKYRFTGYKKFLDPEGYPGRCAAVGDAERDQSEHGRIRLEGPVGRVSGTGREGHEGHRHGELRRPDRRPPAAWYLSRPRTSTASSARSIKTRASCCGRR